MKERNTSIDMFRLAAVALVIIQHYRLFNMNTTAAVWSGFFCRIAVPFFFMVSGYFSWKAESGPRTVYLKKQLVTIGKILAVSAVVIIAFNQFIIDYTIKWRLPYIKRLILFNEPKFLFGHAHMWYMLALIYVLAAGLLIEKLRLHKWAYRLAPVLLLINIILDFVLFNTKLVRRACYTRNWLLDGLPFFYIGQFIHRYEENIRRLMTRGRSLILLAISTVCLGVEGGLLLHFGQNINRTLYLFLPLLAVSVFMVLLSFPGIGKNSLIVRYARDASMVMYVIHHMVEEIIKITALKLWNVRMYQHSTLRFCLIFLFTWAIGMVYAVIINKKRSRT